MAPLERAVRWSETVSSTGVRLRKPEVSLCSCGHAPAQHDHVALRYCAATNAHGSARRCICAATLSPAAVRR
ncbi:MAG: RGCVC family protein [Catenulispora sp.]